MRLMSVSVFLLLTWALLVALSLTQGAVVLSLSDIWSVWQQGTLTEHFVLWNHRLPRMIIATLVGMSLALSGCMVQSVVRNPLASPDILGVTSAAALAVVGLLIYWPDANVHWIPFAALIGGFSAAGLLLLLTTKRLAEPSHLALVGLALGALFSAIVDYLLSKYPLEINGAMLWMTGSVWGRNWSHLPLILPWLLILVPSAIYLCYRLDVLSLGQEKAASLGLKVTTLQVVTLLMAIALASVSVSVCGAIAFVGLVAPHIARFLMGGRHFPVIIIAMLLGAIILLAADTFARAIAPPLEFPAGIFVAMIGAPYFIFLITRYKHW